MQKSNFFTDPIFLYHGLFVLTNLSKLFVTFMSFLRALLKNFKILSFSYKANYKIAFLLQHKIKKKLLGHKAEAVFRRAPTFSLFLDFVYIT